MFDVITPRTKHLHPLLSPCQHFAQRALTRPSACRAITLLCLLLIVPTGCNELNTGGGGGGREASADAPKLRSEELDNPAAPAVSDAGINLSAAKNEWSSFTLQVSPMPAGHNRVYSLRLHPLNLSTANAAIGPENFTAYQVLPMPIEVNRAGYVRHTGRTVGERSLPRALLPVPLNDGLINLSDLRDPRHATDPQSHAAGTGQPVLLWIDLHVPPEARPGQYAATCDVLESGADKPAASVNVNLVVHDFVLPDERHLMMVGQINWADLTRLYPDRFEAVTPRLLNRKDARYEAAIKTLDQLMILAQANRTQLNISRLQPTVKWPADRPPVVTWTDYDSVVEPWLKGDMFPDKVPVGFWPLPPDEHLFNYDPRSQREYWSQAASHFDQMDWLSRSAVFLQTPTGGRADALESMKMSADAASILALNPRLRVAVPLEDDQVAISSGPNTGLIPPDAAPRLITANPGLVFSSPQRNWPEGVARPTRWLRTDLTGLIPYVGAGGDERDVRLWAWLAAVPLPPPQLGVQYGPVQFVHWASALPTSNTPAEASDPNELVWFYPGSWFGVSDPVPTVQLKWLRRAQQDYEYIYLDRQRGDAINSMLMARLMTKPVELAPDQRPDPTFGLMCGTADPAAWKQAKDLLARRILLREPGQPVDKDKEDALNLDTLRWCDPQERPVVMARTANWTYVPPTDGGTSAGVDLKVGIDIYNASDRTPDENSLQWTDGPAGWHWRPQPTAIPQLATYRVERFDMQAHVEPSEVNNTDHRTAQITFTDGFTRLHSLLQMVLPVAVSERREGRLSIDGSLDDWSHEDAIQDGPMVRMFNRPDLQAQRLESSVTPTQIYTGWADENFYLAFKVSGTTSADASEARNWVGYEFRRAWGEDVCQVLIQAVYADGSTGPLLHIACKPNGQNWVERLMDRRIYADPWQAFEGTGVRYATTRSQENGDWRGEVAIPWKTINDPKQHDRPVMLRFNFSQHKNATGESASWAGPIDFGRDNAFMGLLFLQEQNNPGMAGAGH